MTKAVGILGGMGPEATSVFFNLLVRGTPASRDQEHLKILVVNDPRIPDRTQHLLHGGPSPVPDLVRAARDLERIGAQVISIPCNTAHAFYSEISGAVQVPCLNIVTETVAEVGRRVPDRAARVGIMSTQATIRVELYQPVLRQAGFEPVLPNEQAQHWISSSIEILKGQDKRERAAQRLTSAARYFEKQGCEAILLACTELGLVPVRAEVPLLDSLKILAQSTLRFALGSSLDPATKSVSF